MKHKNTGFAHLQLIVGLIVVLSVVGFAAFRVGQSSQTNEQAKDAAEDPSLVQEIAVKEDEKKEVTIPAEKEAVAEEYVAPAPVKKTEPAPTTEKKKEDKTWLKLQAVSAVQDGATLAIVSRLPSAQTGTCNFKLYQEGQEKVYATSQLSGGTDCVGSINVGSLPTYDGWELHVWFDSSDGKVSAYQQEAAIALTNPN